MDHRSARRPVWSLALTGPIARHVPVRCHEAAMVAVKAIHTAAFVSIASLVAVVAWDGVRQHPRRRTAAAAAVGLGEAIVYLSNNQVCPLTPLAEDLGARSGTVTDIFLPGWFSKRVPVVSGTALVVGLYLNGRTWLRRRSAQAGRGAQGKGPGPRGGSCGQTRPFGTVCQ